MQTNVRANMRNLFGIILTIILLSGCNKLHPYCVTIQQGNIIDAGLRTKLHLGMSKAEVNALLGTPVLSDIFDKDLWIYAYTNQINCGKIEKQQLLLKFKHDKLATIK